jgi:dihydroxyacetone kinase-like protein
VSISRSAVVEGIKAVASGIGANKEYHTQIDSDIGDSDHGANMNRGFQAVPAKLPGAANKDVGAVLKTMGMTLVSGVGGAGGPLYGTFFIQMSTTAADKLELKLAGWSPAVPAGVTGVAGVVKRGKVNLGDKTMLDALTPAVEALKAASAEGASLPKALRRSEQAAEQGLRDTIPLVARKGRAGMLASAAPDAKPWARPRHT